MLIKLHRCSLLQINGLAKIMVLPSFKFLFSFTVLDEKIFPIEIFIFTKKYQRSLSNSTFYISKRETRNLQN